MAEVKNSVLGVTKGRVDNYVYWTKNGKQFVSKRPRHYKASKSKAAVAGRNNFAAFVNLATLVNSIPLMKQIWTDAKTDGTNSYYRIMKYNSRFIKAGSLTVSNKITPEGLPLILSSAAVKNNILSLDLIFPMGNNINFPLALFILFYFDEYDKSLFYLSGNIDSASPGDSYSVDIRLDSNIVEALKTDPQPIIYAALSEAVSNKTKIYWSSTVSTQKVSHSYLDKNQMQ